MIDGLPFVWTKGEYIPFIYIYDKILTIEDGSSSTFRLEAGSFIPVKTPLRTMSKEEAEESVRLVYYQASDFSFKDIVLTESERKLYRKLIRDKAVVNNLGIDYMIAKSGIVIGSIPGDTVTKKTVKGDHIYLVSGTKFGEYEFYDQIVETPNILVGDGDGNIVITNKRKGENYTVVEHHIDTMFGQIVLYLCINKGPEYII